MNFFTVLITRPLFNLLIGLSMLGPGTHLAVGIVLLTFLTRLLLLPSSLKALRAQRKLQAISQRIGEVRDQHKDDQRKQTEELMRLYRAEGVHPLSSCLPLLIQFPILIGLYLAVQQGLNLDGTSLLYPFIPKPETISTSFFGLNLAQPDRIFLPLLAGLLTYVQIRQTSSQQLAAATDPAAQFARQSKFIFPAMTVIFAIQLPAALPLYWSVSNLFSIAQQWWIDKSLPKAITSHEPQATNLPAGKADHKPEERKEKGKGGVELVVRRKEK